MNKEEIKHFKAMLRQGLLRHMNILLDDKFQKELLNIIKDYEKLQQENQQLKEDIKGYEQERQKIYNSIPFKENKQLKEQVEYLRRSCERKEDTIISLEQDLAIIDELEKWIKDLSTEKINSFGDKGKCVAIWNYAILDKINELKDRDIK